MQRPPSNILLLWKLLWHIRSNVTCYYDKFFRNIIFAVFNQVLYAIQVFTLGLGKYPGVYHRNKYIAIFSLPTSLVPILLNILGFLCNFYILLMCSIECFLLKMECAVFIILSRGNTNIPSYYDRKGKYAYGAWRI